MKRTRTIAPRLFNGTCRIPIGHGLPEEIKKGLKDIAVEENESASWVLEQVIIDYFGLKKPRYVVRKKGNGGI